MMTTNNVTARRSMGRILSLNISNIRITAHFVPARRYSTSVQLGRSLVRTTGSSVTVMGDPMNVPKHTVVGPFVRRIVTKRGVPRDPYRHYLTGYSPNRVPCYVASGLVTTMGNSIRGNLLFYKTGTCVTSGVRAIRSIVTSLFNARSRYVQLSWEWAYTIERLGGGPLLSLLFTIGAKAFDFSANCQSFPNAYRTLRNISERSPPV